MKKCIKNILKIITILVIISGASSYVYLSNYYHASSFALNSTKADENDNFTITYEPSKILAYEPTKITDETIGLIFYPGAKVEFTAYAPLLQHLAQEGIACYDIHMPGNMAILNISAANDIVSEHPQISHWYIAGHSLGGASAAMYLQDPNTSFDGLIFLAAFSSVDLSSKDIRVLSIYGENDQVLDLAKYQEYKNNLPSDITEYIIAGGCHAYFGDYGKQEGDGTPTITADQQQDITAQQIIAWLRK